MKKMKKKILLLLLLVSIKFYSQIAFEEGYYIDESDKKIECLIKNMDWDYNPTEFRYKLSENTEEKKATIEKIKEFGVYSASKYIRGIVHIEKSSNSVDNLDYDRGLFFEKETLFLKVLVDGKSDLFSYKNEDLVSFFYRKENSNIEQLIFKSYLMFNKPVGKNFKYKEQLWSNLKYLGITQKKIIGIAYREKDLVDFFVEYNESWNQEFVSFGDHQKKDLFNLTFRPRLNISSLSTSTSTSGIIKNKEINTEKESYFGFGIEAEIIFPAANNKWALIFEPTFQFFKSEQELVDDNRAKVNYKSVDLPIGVRYYLYSNNNSKLFMNASYIMSIAIKSKITYDNGGDFPISSNANSGFGLGYKYKDKLSIELRYHTDRNVLDKYGSWTSSYKVPLSVIFGYSIF